MAIFFKSFKNIYASNSKMAFLLSLLAVATWLIAISFALFSDSLALRHGKLIITTFLVVSAFFSINAIPRTPSSLPAQRAATSKKELL
jgi:hypothetical protein